MTDRTDLDPSDRRLGALIAAARALPPRADAPDVEVDPARVAAHFDAARDEALLDRAADDDGLAALLADVADALAAAEDAEALAAASPPPSSPHGTVAATPLAALAPRRRFGVAWRVAAAVLLVVAPLALLSTWGSRPVEAGPLLALERIERRGTAGAVTADGPTSLRVGAEVAAAAGERWALGLPGGARYVVGDGDVLRVVCDREGASACGRAVLALHAGAAVVAAGASGAVLVTPDGGRLELVEGAAHVERRDAGAVAVALRDDALARWTPAGATAARELAGPSSLVLAGAEATEAAARDAATLFRDLAFFGGTRARPDRRVSARAWRAVGAPEVAPARSSEGGGAPSLRFDLAAGREARLTWVPDDEALAARSVRVLVRLRSARSDAAGTPIPDTTLPLLRVRLDGVPGAEGTLAPPAEHDGSPVGTRSVVLALPEGFAFLPAGAPLVLVLRAERAGASVWFEGAAFSPAEPGVRAPAPGR